MKSSIIVGLGFLLCVLSLAQAQYRPRCSGVVCPEGHMSGYTVLLPNPYDCSSFCQCTWGIPIKHKCPSGLHFNADLMVCDWPQSANCKAETTTTTIGTTTKSPCTGFPDPSKKQCPPEVSAQCPSIDDPYGYATHYPYPGNCSKFCHCSWGVAYEKECPPGLHFNEDLEVCDWPSSAGCDSGPPPPPPPPPTTTTTKPPCASTPDPTKKQCPIDVSARCPPTDDQYGYAVHLSYPGDCSKFCHCSWGVAYEKDCAPGTWFNKDIEVCDSPANVTPPC